MGKKADTQEIKRAFKRLAMRNHPDVSKDPNAKVGCPPLHHISTRSARYRRDKQGGMPAARFSSAAVTDRRPPDRPPIEQVYRDQ